MKTFQHSLCNDILRGNPETGVSDLHITRDKIDGIDVVASYWKPSPAELKALKEGSPVVFMCVGRTHPPIKLEVLAKT